MKSLKEAGPPELDAVRKRAIRDLAMGRITTYDCDMVVSKIDDVVGFIHNMEEREEEE
jgi:hypothetical protein